MTSAALAAPEGLDLVTRPMVRTDRGFVVTSWLKSYEHLSRIPRTVYLVQHPKLVDRLLDDPSTRVLVATSPNTPSLILGFVVAGASDVVHYAYLSRDVRGVGLGRWLVESILGSYPRVVTTSHRWPWPSARYLFNGYLIGML